MTGYKAYDHGLTCRGKQYEVGKVYEEDKAVICECGMHYCDNPADLMFYHDLVDESGSIMDVTEVEDLAPDTTDYQQDGQAKKYCTTKLKIGAKIDFKDWVKAAVGFLLERTSSDEKGSKASSDNFARLASSEHLVRLASSGDYAQLASSGNFAHLASSGHLVRLASSGNFARLASSGNFAQLASSGNFAQLALSGDSTQLASLGDYAQLASSGDCAHLASSGDCAQLASLGYSAQLASSGNDSVIAAIGVNNKAKGAVGNWITLAEWEYDKKKGSYVPKCVKTEYVDGKKIKANTWYVLQDGEFKED